MSKRILDKMAEIKAEEDSAKKRKNKLDNSVNIRIGHIISKGGAYFEIKAITPCETFVVATRGDSVAIVETQEIYMNYEYRNFNKSWFKKEKK